MEAAVCIAQTQRQAPWQQSIHKIHENLGLNCSCIRFWYFIFHCSIDWRTGRPALQRSCFPVFCVLLCKANYSSAEMASDSHFVVPAAAAGGIKRSHKSPNVADGYATKPCKKRVDRKDTPVGFDSDMTLGSDDFSHSAARGAAVPNKKKAKRDSDAIISPPHPKWNRTMDLRLRELVSKLGTLSWKAVRQPCTSIYSVPWLALSFCTGFRWTCSRLLSRRCKAPVAGSAKGLYGFLCLSRRYPQEKLHRSTEIVGTGLKLKTLSLLKSSLQF